MKQSTYYKKSGATVVSKTRKVKQKLEHLKDAPLSKCRNFCCNWQALEITAVDALRPLNLGLLLISNN